VRVKLPSVSDSLKHDIFRMGDLWNDGLARFGGPFLTGGHFTAADAFFAPVAFRAQSYGLVFEGAASAYPQRLLDLPDMREWYASGLAETWREAGHEAEIAAAGTLVEDLRATA
jgi:glutathione S-transferase